jgi:hypothetical protein
MVPEVGIEPTWGCPRGILSPVRLPISPLRHDPPITRNPSALSIKLSSLQRYKMKTSPCPMIISHKFRINFNGMLDPNVFTGSGEDIRKLQHSGRTPGGDDETFGCLDMVDFYSADIRWQLVILKIKASSQSAASVGFRHFFQTVPFMSAMDTL